MRQDTADAGGYRALYRAHALRLTRAGISDRGGFEGCEEHRAGGHSPGGACVGASACSELAGGLYTEPSGLSN